MREIQTDGTPIGRGGAGEQSKKAAAGDVARGGHEWPGKRKAWRLYGRARLKPEHATEMISVVIDLAIQYLRSYCLPRLSLTFRRRGV